MPYSGKRITRLSVCGGTSTGTTGTFSGTYQTMSESLPIVGTAGSPVSGSFSGTYLTSSCLVTAVAFTGLPYTGDSVRNRNGLWMPPSYLVRPRKPMEEVERDDQGTDRLRRDRLSHTILPCQVSRPGEEPYAD